MVVRLEIQANHVTDARGAACCVCLCKNKCVSSICCLPACLPATHCRAWCAGPCGCEHPPQRAERGPGHTGTAAAGRGCWQGVLGGARPGGGGVQVCRCAWLHGCWAALLLSAASAASGGCQAGSAVCSGGCCDAGALPPLACLPASPALHHCKHSGSVLPCTLCQLCGLPAPAPSLNLLSPTP